MKHIKKIIISCIITIIPVLFVMGVIPITMETHSTFAPYEVEEVTNLSDVILKGKVESKTTSLQLIDGKPSVMTIYEIIPTSFIKGEKTDDGETVTVKVLGGTYNNIVHYTGHPELEVNEIVLLMLSLEPHTIYGDDYYISGVLDGYYKLKDGEALNSNLMKSLNEDMLLDKIQTQLRK